MPVARSGGRAGQNVNSRLGRFAAIGRAPAADSDQPANVAVAKPQDTNDGSALRTLPPLPSVTLPLPTGLAHTGAAPARAVQQREPPVSPVQVGAAELPRQPAAAPAAVQQQTSSAFHAAADNRVDMSTLRAAFLALAGMLTLATAVRLVIG
ncbi:MAG TPA: hypothetical protein VHG27_10015 [Xanthobacteraceae bacterium]|nr:hypothetical protein [Xanthobacteraceae bacterium]